MWVETMKKFRGDKNNSVLLVYCILAVMVLSVFTTTMTSTSSEGNNLENAGYSTTKSKDTPTDKTKILFVFDDNGTVWIEWYLTIIKSLTTAGKVLNRTDLETSIYFVWDPNEDYISSVFNGTPDPTLIEGKRNGPAYSGGNYLPIFNNNTKQFEYFNFDLKNYSAVIWFTGIDSKYIDGETLTSTDIANLKQYLDNGGKLWLCSPELIADIYGIQSGTERYNFVVFPTGDFLPKYVNLYGAYQDFGTPDTLIGTEKGLTASAIYHTINYSIGTADIRAYGDHISPFIGGATEIFNSTASQTQKSLGWNDLSVPYINAVQWNNRNPLDSSVAPYKTVFFSFEFASIETETERINLMDQVLKYLTNILPRVTVTTPTEGQAISGTFSINGTSSDTDGTVQRVRIILDSATILMNITTNLASWTYSFDTTKVTNGAHQIMVVAWDGADNSNVSFVNFTVNNIGGNNPPTVAISSPAANAEVSGTITISGTASDLDGDSQLSNVQIKVDSGSWVTATGTASWSYSLDTTQHSNGAHTIYAKANDGIVDSTVVSRTVNINNPVITNNPPVVTITYPDERDTPDGRINVTGTASDPDGNAITVQVRLDTAPWSNAVGNTSWSYQLDTTAFTNGTAKKISVRAYDGNSYSSVVSRNITIRNNPPTAYITYSPQSIEVGALVTLDGTSSSDTEGSTPTYTWTIDSQPSASSVSLSSSTASKPTFTPTHEGIYRIKLIVNDGVQESTPAFVDITVTTLSTPKPDITISDIAFKKGNTAVTAANVNDIITIFASIKNIGNANASNVKILFFNGNPFINGTQIGAEQSISSIAFNGSYDVSVVNNFTKDGNFTIFVFADKSGAISELREDNNNLSKSIMISAAPLFLPNLKIIADDISFSSTEGRPLGFVTEGDKIQITAKVRNTKNEEFKGTVKVKFYAGPVSSGKLIESYDKISTISANSYQEASCTWESKKGVPIEIYVVVESGTNEFDTTDNIAHKPIFILEKTIGDGGGGDTGGAIPGFQIAALFVALCFAYITKKSWKTRK
jgi:hypothetical protein